MTLKDNLQSRHKRRAIWCFNDLSISTYYTDIPNTLFVEAHFLELIKMEKLKKKLQQGFSEISIICAFL